MSFFFSQLQKDLFLPHPASLKFCDCTFQLIRSSYISLFRSFSLVFHSSFKLISCRHPISFFSFCTSSSLKSTLLCTHFLSISIFSLPFSFILTANLSLFQLSFLLRGFAYWSVFQFCFVSVYVFLLLVCICLFVRLSSLHSHVRPPPILCSSWSFPSMKLTALSGQMVCSDLHLEGVRSIQTIGHRKNSSLNCFHFILLLVLRLRRIGYERDNLKQYKLVSKY